MTRYPTQKVEATPYPTLPSGFLACIGIGIHPADSGKNYIPRLETRKHHAYGGRSRASGRLRVGSCHRCSTVR